MSCFLVYQANISNHRNKPIGCLHDHYWSSAQWEVRNLILYKKKHFLLFVLLSYTSAGPICETNKLSDILKLVISLFRSGI